MWFTSELFQGYDYADARRMLDNIMQLSQVWGTFVPEKPLRRSGFGVLATMRYAFEEGDEPTIGGLARLMRQSPAAISQKVQQLEADGYLTRRQSSSDKRSAALVLTAKGTAAVEDGLNLFLSRMQRVLDEVGEEETGQLLHLMGRLQNSIEKVQKEYTGTC